MLRRGGILGRRRERGCETKMWGVELRSGGRLEEDVRIYNECGK